MMLANESSFKSLHAVKRDPDDDTVVMLELSSGENSPMPKFQPWCQLFFTDSAQKKG
jgi:hypothetical protein